MESLCFFSKALLHAVLFPYDVSRSVLHGKDGFPSFSASAKHAVA